MAEKLPTVKIKGSDYTLVKDRILFFNENYPSGCIYTRLISDPASERVIIQATVIPDTNTPDRVFSDYSQAVIGDGYINKSAAMENASTSAVGRALALMGIGVIESTAPGIASADEVNKAIQQSQPKKVIPKNDPLPPELHEDGTKPSPEPLSPELAQLADELDPADAISPEQHTKIQNRLKELVSAKVFDRRKLTLYLDKRHGGKKSFAVSAAQWKETMDGIENAVKEGDEAVKALLKG